MSDSTVSPAKLRVVKALGVVGWVVAALLFTTVAVALLVAATLNSSSGRVWLVSKAEQLVNKHTAYHIDITRLKMPEMGRWSFDILSVSTQKGLLLEIKNFELHWSPYQLTQHTLAIKNLSVGSLRVDADGLPGSEPDAPEDPATSTEPFTLPWLTAVEVEQAQVSRLELHRLLGFAPLEQGDTFAAGLTASARWQQHQILDAALNIKTLAQVAQTLQLTVKQTENQPYQFSGRLQESESGPLSAYLQLPQQQAIDAYFEMGIEFGTPLNVDVDRLKFQLLDQTIDAQGLVSVNDNQNVTLSDWTVRVGDTYHQIQGYLSPEDIELKATVNALPLAIFSVWLPDIEGGELNADVSLSGALSAPLIDADIDLATHYRQQPVQFDATLRSSGSTIDIRQLKGSFAETTFGATGDVAVVEQSMELQFHVENLTSELIATVGVELPPDFAFTVQQASGNLSGPWLNPNGDLNLEGTAEYQRLPIALQASLVTQNKRVRIHRVAATVDESTVVASGDINLTDLTGDIGVNISDLTLDVVEKAGFRIPDDLNLAASGDVRVSGELSAPGIEANIHANGEYNQVPMVASVDGSWIKQQLHLNDLTLGFDGRNAVAVRLNVANDQLQANLQLDALDTQYLSSLGVQVPQGILDGKVSLSGPVTLPNGQVKMEFTGKLQPSNPDSKDFSLGVDAKLQQGALTVVSEMVLAGQTAEPVVIDADIRPMVNALRDGQAVADAPLQVSAKGGVNLDIVSHFLPDSSQSIEGRIQVDVSAKGVVSRPEVNGQITLSDIGYTNYSTGTVINRFHCAIQSQRYRFSLTDCQGQAGDDGSISVQGDLELPIATAGDINLQVNAKKASVLNTSTLEGQLDGTVGISGDFQAMTVSGSMDIREFIATLYSSMTHQIPTLEVERQTYQEAAEETDTGPTVALDLKLHANNKAYLRGRGLDSELKGVIVVAGTASSPQVEGKLGTVRGSLTLFGKKFRLVKGDVEFSNDAAFVAVEATYTHSEQTITANLSGTPDQLEIQLSSQPSMPEDEILAYIIFGKSVQDISPVQALQLASAVNTLRGEGGFDPVDATRQLLGADTLYVESAESGSGLNVGVGKYLNEKVYLELQRTSNPSQPWKGQLEIELTPNLNLESSTGGKSGIEGAQLKWKHNY